jgi:hypothetical protein
VIPSEATREPMVLRHDDPHRPVAIEGDTFIKPDGTAVVLKIGPSGVLGEEQGCATELGRAHPNGKLLEAGDLCSHEQFLGQPYLVDKKTGEGHYKTEWLDISQSMKRRAFDTLGHPEVGTTFGPWLIYMYGQWCWIGPVK